MIVYHASSVRVEKPDTAHSRQYLDFGRGFYLTTIEEQAVNYAERFRRRGNEAWLNIYELDDDLSGCKVLRFEAYDEEWLDFVARCRKGEDAGEHEIVIGGIADDRVFRTIDLFFVGDITKEQALQKLIYERPNMQICIRSEEVLRSRLKFIESRKL